MESEKPGTDQRKKQAKIFGIQKKQSIMKSYIEKQIAIIELKLEVTNNETQRKYLHGKLDAYNDILSIIVKSETVAEKCY
jgi:hypothetical protein